MLYVYVSLGVVVCRLQFLFLQNSLDFLECSYNHSVDLSSTGRLYFPLPKALLPPSLKSKACLRVCLMSCVPSCNVHPVYVLLYTARWSLHYTLHITPLTPLTSAPWYCPHTGPSHAVTQSGLWHRAANIMSRAESDHGAPIPNTRRKSEILVMAVLLADGMMALRAGTSAWPHLSPVSAFHNRP